MELYLLIFVFVNQVIPSESKYVLNITLLNFTTPACKSQSSSCGERAIFVVPVSTDVVEYHKTVIPICVNRAYTDKHCTIGSCTGTECTSCLVDSTGCFNETNITNFTSLKNLKSQMTFNIIDFKKYLYLVIKVVENPNLPFAVDLGTSGHGYSIERSPNLPYLKEINLGNGTSLWIRTEFTKTSNAGHQSSVPFITSTRMNAIIVKIAVKKEKLSSEDSGNHTEIYIGIAVGLLLIAIASFVTFVACYKHNRVYDEPKIDEGDHSKKQVHEDTQQSDTKQDSDIDNIFMEIKSDDFINTPPPAVSL